MLRYKVGIENDEVGIIKLSRHQKIGSTALNNPFEQGLNGQEELPKNNYIYTRPDSNVIR